MSKENFKVQTIKENMSNDLILETSSKSSIERLVQTNFKNVITKGVTAPIAKLPQIPVPLSSSRSTETSNPIDKSTSTESSKTSDKK